MIIEKTKGYKFYPRILDKNSLFSESSLKRYKNIIWAGDHYYYKFIKFLEDFSKAEKKLEYFYSIMDDTNQENLISENDLNQHFNKHIGALKEDCKILIKPRLNLYYESFRYRMLDIIQNSEEISFDDVIKSPINNIKIYRFGWRPNSDLSTINTINFEHYYNGGIDVKIVDRHKDRFFCKSDGFVASEVIITDKGFDKKEKYYISRVEGAKNLLKLGEEEYEKILSLMDILHNI